MKRLERPAAAVISALAVVLFACLARAVAFHPPGAFDLAVRSAVHAWASPPLTLAMRSLTQLGSANFLLPAGVLIFCRLATTARRGAAALLAVASLGAEAWDDGLKLLFHRARPDAFFGLAQPETYSFPSGHSMLSVCFYGSLAAIVAARAAARGRWAVAAAAAVAGCVGFSRVYLGVHYPTDVLGGYLAAIAWLALIRAFTPRDTGKSTSPPAPPVSPPSATPAAR